MKHICSAFQTVVLGALEFDPGVMNAGVGVPFTTGDGLLAPVPARRWRGSIVGEIIDDGAYKVEDESTEEQGGSWSDNTVWVTESNDGDSVGGTVPGVWMS